MVDPRGFRAPWHLFGQLSEGRSLLERGLGYLIEHSHRLAGFAVGAGVIVLAVGLWLTEPRRWLRRLGLLALLAVCAQGILGIGRVELNARMGGNLALVHGCFAHLVLALLTSIALFTSQSWQLDGLASPPHQAGRLRRASLLAGGIVYLQLVLGGLVRHRDFVLGARAHFLIAFAVVLAVAWLIREVLDSSPRSTQQTTTALVLAGLVGLQLVLGLEAWLGKFATPAGARALTPLAVQSELVRSVHYLVGSLVFSSTVIVALQAHRPQACPRRPATASAGNLEGAA